MEQTKVALPQCDPCSQTKKENAEHYCKECDEYYCDRCVASHRSQRTFKNHVVLTIADVVPTYEYCEPCYEKQKHVHPVKRCEECEEYLCEACSLAHCSQKQNKGHTLKPLPSLVSCNPCSSIDPSKIATVYCLNCEDPEPLCDDCADQHKRMKKTKNHKMSEDKFTLNLKFTCKLDEFESKIENKGETAKAQTPVMNVSKKNTETLCEPCEERGKATQAEYFCDDCTERYCKTCMQKHMISKNTKTHNIGDIPQGAHYSNICSPCNNNDVLTVANNFCRNCEENFCGNCMKIHRLQSIYRNHKFKVIADKILPCAICCELGKQSEATCFCLDCENKEPLCRTCAEEHTTLKRSRSHRLSKDISILTKSKCDDVPTSDKLKSHNEKEQEKIKKEIPDVKPHIVENNARKPDKPYVTEGVNKSDQIILKWEYKSGLGEEEFYQIVMKQHPEGKWKVFHTSKPCIYCVLTVDGLKAETKYVFKVRVSNDKMGEEGPFSPESDVILTGESPAFRIMKRSEKIDNGFPKVYRLPIREVKPARNEGSQTRKFILGTPRNNTKEKTIMIVGATGSGKSTLINGMANYVLGVKWEDPFRFTLIHLEKCEQEREGNEALSQTEWITLYTICKDVASQIDYTINFIDTPGFGDTRGIAQDAKIISQIRDLFTEKDEKGVATLDAVCFILKAPDARLTTTQKYIFESILALFGNDIKNNICTLVTFADGQRPPVLAALEALDDKPLPFEVFFPFNNSALFVDNRSENQESLSPIFWEMGMKSCRAFFMGLNKLQTRSLLLTSEVLANRQKLENTILHLQEEIDLGLSKINVLELQVNIFTKYKREIQDNENFEYEVEESQMEKVDISGDGIHTTTCLICNFTCHNSCAYANDNDKSKCCAMGGEGNCKICPRHCNWKEHSNVPYVFQWYTHKVKRTYSEMKDKYQQAHQKKMSQEDILREMHGEIKILETGIQIKVEEITDYGNRLKEIALRPDPLNTVQYIELMIESEMREKKTGFNLRVATLEQCKKRAEIGKTCEIFEDRLRITLETMKASTAADNAMSDKDDKGGIINRVIKAKDKFSKMLFGTK